VTAVRAAPSTLERIVHPLFVRLRRMRERRSESERALTVEGIGRSVASSSESGLLAPAGRRLTADPLDARTGTRIAALGDADAEFPAPRWHVVPEATLPGTLRTGWISGDVLYVKESQLWDHLRRAAEREKILKFHGLSPDPESLGVRWEDATVSRIDEGIYLGGFAADNWSHWLTEFLPRAWLSQRLPEEYSSWPLLVPGRALRIPQFRDSLDALATGRCVIAVPDWDQVRVGRLLWLDGVVQKAELGADSPNDVSYHELARDYRASLLVALALGPSDREPLRVFLDRPTGSRPYNRDAVLDVVRKFGFVPHRCGEKSFREQAEIFLRAGFVVGPSGADWTNLLFAQPGTRCLYWVSESLSGLRTWASLGAVSGAEVHELTYDTPKGGFHSNEAYFLGPTVLEDAVARLLQH
jgi:hypothetical protein